MPPRHHANHYVASHQLRSPPHPVAPTSPSLSPGRPTRHPGLRSPHPCDFATSPLSISLRDRSPLSHRATAVRPWFNASSSPAPPQPPPHPATHDPHRRRCRRRRSPDLLRTFSYAGRDLHPRRHTLHMSHRGPRRQDSVAPTKTASSTPVHHEDRLLLACIVHLKYSGSEKVTMVDSTLQIGWIDGNASSNN